MLTRILGIFVVTGLCVGPISTVEAAKIKGSDSLYLNFSKGKMGLDEKTQDEEIETSTVEVQPKEGVTIYVSASDANPLLFSYKGEVFTTPTDSAIAVANFVSEYKEPQKDKTSLTTFAENKTVPAEGVYVVEVGGVNVEDYKTQYKSLLAKVQQITRRIDETLGMDSEKIDGVKDVVNHWGAKEIETFMTDALKKMSAIKSKNKNEQKVEVRLKLFNGINETSIQDLNVSIDLNALDGLVLPEKFEPYNETVKKSIQSFSKQLDEQQTTQAILTTMTSFVKDVSKLKQKIPLTKVGGERIKIQYDAEKKHTVKVTVSPVSTFQKLMSPAALKHQQKIAGEKGKDYEIVFNPYERFIFTTSIGAVTSFVNNPEFGVKDDAVGYVTVTSTSNSSSEVKPALALNITPSSFVDQGFAPFLQVGLTPTGESVAFFAGLGFTAFKNFSIAAGGILQEVNTLPAGVKVGDNIRMEDFKVEEEFKVGLYISATFIFSTAGK